MRNKTSIRTASPREILVLKLRYLGDVLLMTPVFAALREAFPQANITACVQEGTETILRGNTDVDRILVVPRGKQGRSRTQLWQEDLALSWQLRRARFDLAIDLTGSDRSAFLSWISRAPQRWGYRSNKGFFGKNRVYTTLMDFPGELHAVARNLRILQLLGLKFRESSPKFLVRPEARAFISNLVGGRSGVVQVHPFARKESKRWPAESMAAAVNWLGEQHFFPVFTGSGERAEKEWIQKIIAQIQVPHLDLSGQLNLEELGALSQQADFYFGMDTGPMHIAAALGTPVACFFGSSSELVWGPWCEQKLILSRNLDCRLPCKLKETCKTLECLRDLSPPQAISQLEPWVAEIRMRQATSVRQEG